MASGCFLIISRCRDGVSGASVGHPTSSALAALCAGAAALTEFQAPHNRAARYGEGGSTRRYGHPGGGENRPGKSGKSELYHSQYPRAKGFPKAVSDLSGLKCQGSATSRSGGRYHDLVNFSKGNTGTNGHSTGGRNRIADSTLGSSPVDSFPGTGMAARHMGCNEDRGGGNAAPVCPRRLLPPERSGTIDWRPGQTAGSRPLLRASRRDHRPRPRRLKSPASAPREPYRRRWLTRR